MEIRICEDAGEVAVLAAKAGAQILRDAAETKSRLTLVVPTGASQILMIEQFVQEPGIPWSRIDVFHLDEYAGISADHPASFKRYLLDRFVAKLPELGAFHGITGDAGDLDAEIARLNGILGDRTIDLCFAGIGENGHLAFNDPPADFSITDPYIQVALDTVCRQQQVNEGWFDSLDDVPVAAVTMSVNQIMKSDALIISVPDGRKAKAVRNSIQGEIDPLFPASILRQHENCFLLLDLASSSLLREQSDIDKRS